MESTHTMLEAFFMCLQVICYLNPIIDKPYTNNFIILSYEYASNVNQPAYKECFHANNVFSDI